ncbi:serine/threonine-protein kinase [Fodinibius sediminis]|uniref:Serine/threonine protein kinase n=1 Tax=Fodinibius sediminis TaxID=1214077 RepID=A0A521B1E7_9BACT|nr:serine/threonine-protein kinase [Fodinibius sediminis]SMO40922.1 serine/threonine protein kinase [Fodinibius sediminis]
MNHNHWDRIESIIDQVLTLPEHRQQAYIEQACEGNEELKGEITLLLESIFDSKGWLENPGEFKESLYEDIANEQASLSDSATLLGYTIGAYTLEELLGEGGMGAVYLARRSDGAFEHQVAVKVIREGRASETNIRRFQQERNILAGLNHPGIAKLFDGGVTDDGFPYFVMEYVDGVPIDQYCQKRNLSLNHRIALFTDVLKAVRHAHENLVIHRDLKPDNILINTSGEVKILDFGISKLLVDNDNSISLTQTRNRILTPRYAAPEQIRQQAVTTATDIYALGVVLYRLLWQSYPYNIDSASQYQLEQCIVKKPPQPPSANAQPEDPRQIKQIKGDLDAIALKAIRKEPEERYRGISEFIEDLHRLEQGLPVSAREGSSLYQVKKILSRHKKGMSMAAGGMALLLALIGFYTQRIAEERNQAQLEAAKARETKDFMLNIFNQTNPARESYSGNDISAKSLLVSGIDKVENNLSDQPATYIELLVSIGDALENISAYESSEQAYTKALNKSRNYYGKNAPKTAAVLSDMATLERIRGNQQQAESLIVRALNMVEQNQEGPSLDFAHKYAIYGQIKAFQAEYDSAQTLYYKADHHYTASGNSQSVHRYTTLDNLAEVEIRLGEYAQAEEHLLEVHRFYEEFYQQPHYNITQTLSSLGGLYAHMGKYQKSNQYLQKSIDVKTTLLGPDHIALATTYDALSVNYRELNELDKAEEFASRSLSLKKTVHGKKSLPYSYSLNNLGLVFLDRKEYDRAQASYEETISIKESLLEPDHPSLGVAYYNYASVLQDIGDLEEAKSYFERTLAIDKEAYSPEHYGVAIDYNALASVLTELGSLSRADSLFSLSGAIYSKELPSDHYRIAQNLVEHAKLQFIQQKYEQVQQKLEKAISIYKVSFKDTDPRIREAKSLLARSRKQYQQDSKSTLN